MFFRSKAKTPTEAAPPAANARTGGETDADAVVGRTWFSLNDAHRPAEDQHHPPPGDAPPAATIGVAVLPATASAVETGGAADRTSATAAPPQDDQQKNIERARQFALALGQITAVALHSKPHQSLKLSEFRSRAVPALLNGQFALASRRDERLGVQTPVTALLWASVSDAVDRQLSAGDGGELKLERGDWRSGPHLWVVDVFGDQAVLPGLLRQLGETQWSGRSVKMFVRDVDGRRVVRVIDTT